MHDEGRTLCGLRRFCPPMLRILPVIPCRPIPTVDSAATDSLRNACHL